MRADPRLADPLLLVLAATRRRAKGQVHDWRHTTGLAALLASARPLAERSPWDVPDLESGGSMAKLLAEAERWCKEREEEKRHG